MMGASLYKREGDEDKSSSRSTGEEGGGAMKEG
jgi:hypothetical protein